MLTICISRCIDYIRCIDYMCRPSCRVLKQHFLTMNALLCYDPPAPSPPYIVSIWTKHNNTRTRLNPYSSIFHTVILSSNLFVTRNTSFTKVTVICVFSCLILFKHQELHCFKDKNTFWQQTLIDCFDL